MDNTDIRITLVCENTAVGAGLLGEHGLSWWIEAGGRRVLFDTGQGLSILRNTERLGARVAIAGGIGRRALDLFAQQGISVCAGEPGATVETLGAACLDGRLEFRVSRDGEEYCLDHLPASSRRPPGA